MIDANTQFLISIVVCKHIYVLCSERVLLVTKGYKLNLHLFSTL